MIWSDHLEKSRRLPPNHLMLTEKLQDPISRDDLLAAVLAEFDVDEKKPPRIWTAY